MSTTYNLGRECSICAGRLTDKSETGICRRCHCRAHLSNPKRQNPETEKRRLAALVEANKRRVYLPWCPPEYHAEYRRMIMHRRFKAHEAKAIILAQIKADLAKLSPFERQERALRNGAQLIANDQKPSLANPGFYGERKAS